MTCMTTGDRGGAKGESEELNAFSVLVGSGSKVRYAGVRLLSCFTLPPCRRPPSLAKTLPYSTEKPVHKSWTAWDFVMLIITNAHSEPVCGWCTLHLTLYTATHSATAAGGDTHA
jgi:hypothetical protein